MLTGLEPWEELELEPEKSKVVRTDISELGFFIISKVFSFVLRSSDMVRLLTPILLAHQGLVVHGSEEGVLFVPAASAEVLEAGQAPAEVGPVAESAKVAEDVVQVGVDLNLPDKWII